MELGVRNRAGERRKNKRPSNQGKRSKPKDLEKHNRFRKDGYRLILPIVADAVREAKQQHEVGEEGTVGRPPEDPHSIASCPLIRAIFGLSYRLVY